jgi:8-oxo-dGTP pyrophosphatase MutT (NUDIX family)
MARDQQFYIGQKVVLERDGKVLVLKDELMGDDLPGGKIQIGETNFLDALKREVYEETGLQIEIGRPFHTGYFEFPLVVKGKRHRNAGKNIYLVFFTAKYLSGNFRLSNEHESFFWVTKENYRSLMKDKTSNIFQAVDKYFSF